MVQNRALAKMMKIPYTSRVTRPLRIVRQFVPLGLFLAALAISGCIDNPNIDTSMPGDVSKFSSCLAPGGTCGGDRLCCEGETCKGGVCSGDATCVGPGGLCNSSADCCGTGQCDPDRHSCGFAVAGCFSAGQACTGSADCCNALTCQNGSCH